MPQRGPLPRRRTSLAILKHATASVRSAPLAATSASWPRERGELVRCGAEGRTREVGDLAGYALRPLGMRVEPGSDGGPAERQLVKAVERALERALAEGELGRPSAELLPERQRRRVHQVRAPDLHDVLESLALGLDALAQRGDRRQEALLDLESDGDVHHGREHVVGRLRAVHVVVGMDRLLASPSMPPAISIARFEMTSFGVHVRLRAAPGLPDDQREVGVERAGDDLVGRAHDEVALGRVELSEVLVGEGRRLLDDAEGADDRAAEAVAADLEVLQAALRLGAPVLVGAHLDLAHAVGFDAHVHGWHALIGRFWRHVTSSWPLLQVRAPARRGSATVRGRRWQREREDAPLLDAALDLDLAPVELQPAPGRSRARGRARRAGCGARWPRGRRSTSSRSEGMPLPLSETAMRRLRPFPRRGRRRAPRRW